MKYLFLLFITLTLSIACQNGQTIDKPSLEGNWELVSAMRNGKITSSLEGAVMKFTTDSIYTNILQEEAPSEYKKTGNKFTQLSPAYGELYYNIETLTDSTLTVNTKIKGLSFRFNFTR